MNLIHNLKRLYEIYGCLGISGALSFLIHKNNYIWRYNYLREKYDKEFDNLVSKYRHEDFYSTQNEIKDFKVWVFWYQGYENMPEIVRCSYKSICEAFSSQNVILLDSSNYLDYAKIPDHIIEKFKKKKMTITQLSDIVRIHLLRDYGGIWCDATLFFCESVDKHSELFGTIFSQKMYDKKIMTCPYNYSPSFGRWAGFLLGTRYKENLLFKFACDFYYLYWQKYDGIPEYLLIDIIFDIAYDYLIQVRREIDKISPNNHHIYCLMDNINSEFNQLKFEEWCKDTFVYKLSWKSMIISDQNSFYSKIVCKVGER